MQGRLLAIIAGDTTLDGAEQEVRTVFLLALVVNHLLWGVQITQSYYYYESYHKTDRAWLKAAVGLLVVSEMIQSICAVASVWNILRDPVGGDVVGWGSDMIPFMGAFTASIVHVFYAQKIWTLLGSPSNYIWTVIVIALSCLQLTAGLGYTIFEFVINITLSEFELIKIWACLWLLTAAVTDIVITGLLTWKLSISRTGIKDTDDIISKLIRLIVETGLATALAQLVGIMVYLIRPIKFYHSFVDLIVPKVYSNSMLALLNSRQKRDASAKWDSRPVDSIRFGSTPMTIDVVSDYELHAQTTSGNGKA